MFRTRKSTIILIAIIIILSLCTLAWITVFNYATQQVRVRVQAAVLDLSKKGYEISFTSLEFSGNPFSIKATLHKPHFKDPKGLIKWDAQEVRVTVHPWQLSTLHYTLPGEQTIVNPRATVKLKDVSGTVHLNSKYRPDTASVVIPDLTPTLEGKAQPLVLKDLSLNVSNIAEPLSLKVSLSTKVENVEKLLNKAPTGHPFTVTLLADFSGYKSGLPFPKSLPAWRDGGGVLEVRQLTIDWPPVAAEIEGTLTLDQDMYPLGSFTSKIIGYEELVNDMVDLGVIKEKHATVAMFMLNLLATDVRGKKQLQAPITLQDKELSVGPVRLMKLKPFAVLQ